MELCLRGSPPPTYQHRTYRRITGYTLTQPQIYPTRFLRSIVQYILQTLGTLLLVVASYYWKSGRRSTASDCNFEMTRKCPLNRF